MLALLQRDGRLVDFLMEDLTAYDDAQIGAAVRDVHAGSRQALERYFTLEPVLDDEEGRPVTLERDVDAARDQGRRQRDGISGDARASSGIAAGKRRGWPCRRCQPRASNVVAPAEVEVS